MANVFQLARIINDTTEAIRFMRNNNLLKRQCRCCNQLSDISLSDGEIFQCNTCHSRYSVRSASIYFNSNLSQIVHMCILYYFSNGSSVTQLLRFIGGEASKKTIIQWYTYYREIMVEWLTRNPPVFRSLVHVDETGIGGQRKYNRGRIDVAETRWLFGIVVHHNHKCYLEFVNDHDMIQ